MFYTIISAGELVLLNADFGFCIVKWTQFKIDTANNLPLYQLLADGLRQWILTGVLVPGERLPSSRELQKLLCISAITVKGGLNLLVEEGLLVRRPRCGTFVAEHLPGCGAKIDPPPCIYIIFSNTTMESRYWSFLLRDLELQLRNVGYWACFCQLTDGLIASTIASFRNCAGVVLCGYNSLACAEEFRRWKVPLVLIGNLDSEENVANELDMVVHNDRERAMISTRHLLDLGHRRIACVTGPGHSKFASEQKKGFVDALREYGLSATENDFFDVDALEYENGIRTGYEIFCQRNRPSAVFAGNDYVAFGIIDTARKLGFSVPEEFSIIGCGGIMPGDAPRTPVLTTTRSLPAESVRCAVKKMLRQIREPGAPCSTSVVRIDTICFGETTRVYRPDPSAETVPVEFNRQFSIS